MDCNVLQMHIMTGISKPIIHRVQSMAHSVMATFNASRRRRLSGYVEVDETMWGSSQKGLHSKPSRCKGAFWAAWERGSGDFIIEQMDWMPSFYKMKGAAPANAVLPLVEKWVLPKTTIFTDGLRAYLKLPKLKDKNYVHYYVCHDKGEWVGPEVTSGQRVHTQSVDGMWGHLKTWLRTRRGVHKSTLAGYVACFEWRSRTKEDSRFTALMSGVVQHWNVTTKEQEASEDEEDEESDLDIDFEALNI